MTAFTPAAWMMLTGLLLGSPTNLRAYGADDELSQHVLDPVLSLGHSNSPLLAHFCQAPKVCLFTGIFGGLLIYLAQLVWPVYQTFLNPETAFMDVTRRVGGIWLFQTVGFLLVLAYLGSGLTGQVGAARLLFSFGRDRVLPAKFFAHLDERRHSPTYNIALLGLVAFVGSLFMNYELTAEILNFGAFLGFMGVNLAVIRQFYGKGQPGSEKSFWKDLVAPGFGFIFSLIIWLGLSRASKVAGSAWFVVGFVYLAFQTRGFRTRPVITDFREPAATLEAELLPNSQAPSP